MLRNPEDYLTSSTGIKYDENNKDVLVKNLKEFLAKHNIKNVSSDLLLQVLTHKSFAHGKKPYNEKLSVFGVHLLKEVSAIHLIKESTVEKNESDVTRTATVEGLDFNVLGTNLCKNLLHKNVIAEFARANIPSIEKDVFWKKRNSLVSDPSQNGENLVLFDCVNSLIGAVNLVNGKAATNEFVVEAMLKGDKSLVALSEKYTERFNTLKKNSQLN